MRRFVIWLSGKFPAKQTSERITIWLGLALAAFGGGWALWEYSNDVAINRVTASLGFYEQYMRTFVLDRSRADELRDFDNHLRAASDSSRCVFIQSQIDDFDFDSKVMSAIESSDCKNLTATEVAVVRAVSFDQERRDEFRPIARAVAREVAKGERVISDLFAFYGGVLSCVDEGNCDKSATIRLFSHDMAGLLNLTCSPDGEEAEVSFRHKMAMFLIEHDATPLVLAESDDDGRTSLFLCEEHRKLDPGLT